MGDLKQPTPPPVDAVKPPPPPAPPAKKNIWSPVDFDAEVYEPMEDSARIQAIRDGIDRDLKAVPGTTPLWMGPCPSGRSMAEMTCENYRVLLRRIAELEADIRDLLDRPE